MIHKLRLLALASLLSAPVALAQQQSPEQVIAFLDKGGDGKVDADEYAKFQVGRLSQSDANTDGKLSPEEFTASLAAGEKRLAAQSFPTFDQNADQGIEPAEFAAYHAYVFRTFIDTDKDGYMSAAELAAVQQPAPAAAPAPAPSAAASALAMLDYNKDGKTDLNEYLNFQMPNLKTFDANGNGRLSRDEFKESLPASAKSNAPRSFAAFDRDKDNGLEQQEYLGYHAFVFKNVLDKNKDEFIDASEWQAIRSGGQQ
jgi:Ca2+-binding EF-hand superfamily protein